LVRANFYNPLCQFIVKATQPLLKPLRRVIPSMFGLDMSSLVLALIIQMLLIAVILLLKGFMVDWLFLVPWALIALFSLFLNIIFWAMIISVILSWVAPGSHNPGAELVAQITEPVLAPFRRIIPNLGGLDISPIFAFIVIQLLQSWLIPRLANFALMPMGLLGLI
jgi:YggT family protein